MFGKCRITTQLNWLILSDLLFGRQCLQSNLKKEKPGTAQFLKYNNLTENSNNKTQDNKLLNAVLLKLLHCTGYLC